MQRIKLHCLWWLPTFNFITPNVISEVIVMHLQTTLHVFPPELQYKVITLKRGEIQLGKYKPFPGASTTSPSGGFKINVPMPQGTRKISYLPSISVNRIQAGLTLPLRKIRLSLVQVTVAFGLDPVTSHCIVYSSPATICLGFCRISTVRGLTGINNVRLFGNIILRICCTARCSITCDKSNRYFSWFITSMICKIPFGFWRCLK